MINERRNEDGQALLSVAEARKQLGGISKWTFYRLKRDGKIETVKIGSRTFIAASDIAMFIERLRAEAQA
jgi:excisionase family DNA binding protein